MSTLGDLTVRIGADDSQYKDTMKSVSDRLKSFASETLTVAKDLAGGLSAAFTAAGLVDKIWDTNLTGGIKNSVLDFTAGIRGSVAEMASSVKASAAQMGASLSTEIGGGLATATAAAQTAGASIAGAFRTMGGAAAAAEPEIAAVGVTATATTGALSELWAGLVSSAGGAAGGVVFAGIAAGAVAAGAAVLSLVQATNAEITAQSILAAQTGNSFVDVATFQGAGRSLGVGNSLLDLLGGGGLNADLAQLSQLAASYTGVGQALSSTFQGSDTQGSIEQLVAAFQALPDPIDRANLAVQLFGKNAAEGLALMNQGTVDAINHANELAISLDQGTRESLQRITDAWQSFKNVVLAPFDFSNVWSDLKAGVISAITSIEQPWHTFFVQLGADWHDAMAAMTREMTTLGLGGNYGVIEPDLSLAQMNSVMKNATANTGAPGSPFSIPSPASQVPNQLAAAQAIISANNAEGLSYSDLTSHVSSLTTSLAKMQEQFSANKLNPAMTDQNILLADAIVKTQALIDKDQGLIDKADATATAVKALAGAYATLGVTNFGPLLSGITDDSGNASQLSGLGAFNALASKLSGPQLVQAADNLEAKLQEAFHMGAMSAEDFNKAVDKIEAKVAELGDGWTLLTKKFAGFDMQAEIAPLAAELQSINDAMQQSGVLAGDWAAKMIAAKSSMKQFLDSTGTVFSQTLNSTPLIDALNRIQEGSKQAIAEFDLVAQSGNTTLTEVTDGWARVSGAINKIARVDLPSAIEQYNILIAAMTKRGAAEGELLAVQQQLLNLEIKNKELTGADATAEIIALTQKQYETKALADASVGLGEVYVGLRKTFDDAFGSLSKGLADAIVNGKNLGDVFINVGKQIATSILDTIIKGALLPLQDQLNKTGGMFDSLAKSISGSLGKATAGLKSLGGSGAAGAATGGSGEVASEGNALPGGSPGDFGGETGAASGGGSGGGSGGSLGSLTNIVGAVSSVASAISNIISNFQFSHMNKLLGEIEVTTRKIDNAVGENGAESIFGYTKLSSQTLMEIVGELSDLHNDNAAIISLLESGAGGGAGGGGGYGVDLSSILSNISSLTNSINALLASGGSGGGGGGGFGFGGGNALQVSSWGTYTGAPAPSSVAPPADTGQPMWDMTGIPAWVKTGSDLAAFRFQQQYPGLFGPGGAFTPTIPTEASNPWANPWTSGPSQNNFAAILGPLTTALQRDNSPNMDWWTQGPVSSNAAATILGSGPKNLNVGSPTLPINSAQVTINALDPSAKGVGDAFIQYLRSNGMKV